MCNGKVVRENVLFCINALNNGHLLRFTDVVARWSVNKCPVLGYRDLLPIIKLIFLTIDVFSLQAIGSVTMYPYMAEHKRQNI